MLRRVSIMNMTHFGWTLVVVVVVLAGLPGTGRCGQDGAIIEISSAKETGAGSIRAAIEEANAADGPVRIVSRLAEGTEVHVSAQLPALERYGIELEANGLTLKGGHCTRPDGRPGCDGLVVTGPKITIRGLRATGFTFDGIAVRGEGADEVLLERSELFGNLDDGIGISAGAGNVIVRDCVLEGNGFRTKGKGILVFDGASAELLNNLIRGNRDGVTISRRSRATLIGNRIVGNYDKGLGVAGAHASGHHNRIEENGLGLPGRPPPLNRDGLRVTLDSRVVFEDTVIRGNGDAGVVALNDSTVSLGGGRVVDNLGPGVVVRDQAIVEIHEVELEGNRTEYSLEGEGKLVRRR